MTQRIETSVFKSGNSQAVRIPKAFRFSTSAVTVESVPEGLLLRPKEDTVADTLRRLRSFQEIHGIVGGLLEDVDDLPPEPVVDFDEPQSRKRP